MDGVQDGCAFAFTNPDEEFVRVCVLRVEDGIDHLELHHPGGDAAPIRLPNAVDADYFNPEWLRQLLRNQDAANKRVKAAEGRRVGRIIRQVRSRETR